MTRRESLLDELSRLPDSCIDEIADFADFLQAKVARETLNTLVVSESALKKDWLSPEEDEAWQDLA
jgi:hypothetical protein